MAQLLGCRHPSRVSVAKGLARNESEFRSILDMLGVTVADNLPKATNRDWIYSLADDSKCKVTGGRLGYLYSRCSLENGFENKAAYHPGAASSRTILKAAKDAVVLKFRRVPYQEMQTLSLTGRPWDAFDSALIRGDKLIGVLTDREKTPATIAARMLEYGYDNYRMIVGEALGNGEEESVRTFSLEEASQSAFRFPNCLILQRNKVHPRPFGIPESEFHLLNGRNKMITKMPVRLLTLSMLTLREKKSFWDIGFCTGSVSIEAKLQFPELKVTAFEQRPEGKELMERNSRKFGTPGITTVMGDFLETELGGLPAPDAVFIGGHGGKMIEILQKIKEVLLPDGVIVFNSVSEESKALFTKGITQINKKVTQCTRIAVDAFNPIEIMRAE